LKPIAETYLTHLFKDANGDFFACDEKEAKRAILQRFVVGGAIGRYHVMNKHKNGDLMTIDVALRRNEKQWFEKLPPEIEDKMNTQQNITLVMSMPLKLT